MLDHILWPFMNRVAGGALMEKLVGGLTIQVEKTNAIEFDADVLALKYAQRFWGLDQVVATMLHKAGRKELVDDPPPEGQHRLIQTDGIISAPNILVVGIDPIHRFTYSSVRELGYRFLSSLVGAPILVQHIAVTLHGVGFGLESLEAFRAELLGMADAYVKGEYPETLARVTFVDRNNASAVLMQMELENMRSSHPLVKQALGVSPPTEDMASEGRAQVFVSYAREDQSFALQMVDDLMGEQIPVWLDQIAIKPGEHYDKAIQTALKSSEVMILILSNASVKSDNVADEYHYFLRNKKTIIPVLTTDFSMADIPFQLSRLQYIKLEAGYKPALDELMGALQYALSSSR